jgi:hypothetical protein
MPDRISVHSIFDLAVLWGLLVVAAAGLIYVIAIATTLRDLSALEPVAVSGHPDLETWRCAAAVGSGSLADGEPRIPRAIASHEPPAAERLANCPPHARQVRPQ